MAYVQRRPYCIMPALPCVLRYGGDTANNAGTEAC
jgi:hypothetical protein